MTIVFSLIKIIDARRNYRFCSGLFSYLDKDSRIVAFVSNQIIEIKVSDQALGFAMIADFAAGKNESQSIAERVNRQMNLCRKSASRSA